MIVGAAGTLGHLVGCLGRYVFATGVRSEAGKLRAIWNGGLRLVGCVRVTNDGFRRVSPIPPLLGEGPFNQRPADVQRGGANRNRVRSAGQELWGSVLAGDTRRVLRQI